MAKRLILEIDDSALRVAEVHTAGRNVSVEQLLQVKSAAGSSWSDQVTELQTELARRKLGRGDWDVIVNRRGVEIRDINVPPVPNAELPDLLKFMAKNEFASVNDSWKVDFIPFSTDESTSRKVVAAALNPQTWEEVGNAIEKWGGKLRRVLLRPYCLAEWCHSQLDPHRASLVAIRQDRWLDLILIREHQVRLSRTTLLNSAAGAECEQESLGEIKRTSLMATRVLDGRKLEDLLLVGPWSQESESALRDLGSVRRWNPTADNASNVVTIKPTTEPLWVYGAVVGAAAGKTTTNVPGFDFANPRKREERKLDYRKVGLWSGLAATVLLTLAGLGWYMLTSVNQKVAGYEQQLAKLKEVTEPRNNQQSAKQRVGEVAKIDEWYTQSVDWLKELAQISSRLNTADEVILTSLDARVEDTEARFTISGRLSSKDSQASLETQLAQRPYLVRPGKITADDKMPDYRNTFEDSFSLMLNPVERRMSVQDAARAYLADQAARLEAQKPLAAEKAPATEASTAQQQ